MRYLPAIAFMAAAAHAQQPQPFHRPKIIVRPLVEWSDVHPRVKVEVRVTIPIVPAVVYMPMEIPICTSLPGNPTIRIDPSGEWHIKMPDQR
jgi:hypothetical protein